MPIGTGRKCFNVAFSLTTGIIKKLLKIARNRTKKHNKQVMLARSKLNSIETLISQTLIDLKISHVEFKIIVNEEENQKKVKKKIYIKSEDEL